MADTIGGAGGDDTHGDADGDEVRWPTIGVCSSTQGGFATGATPGYRDSPAATVTPGSRPRYPAHAPGAVRDSPAQEGSRGQENERESEGTEKRKGGETWACGRRAGVTIDSGTRIGLAVARNGGDRRRRRGREGGRTVPTVVPTR